MNTKTCFKCKQSKSVDEFYKKSSSKDGLQGNCKACKTLYNQSHYLAHTDMYKEKQLRYGKVYSERNRRYVRDYLLTHPCIECGETDPIVLEFDHREQSNKSFTIGTRVHWINLDSLKNEIAKCDVRCANCHRRRTAIQLGWYKLFEGDTK